MPCSAATSASETVLKSSARVSDSLSTPDGATKAWISSSAASFAAAAEEETNDIDAAEAP